MSSHVLNRCSSRAAFSLVKTVGVLALVCLVVVLGLPSLLHHAEQKCAAEAINYLEHIKELQQRHFAEHGYYAPDPMTLDLALVVPTTFSIEPTGEATGEFPERWSMTLTRQGSVYFGDKYRVTYNQSGLVPNDTLIDADLVPCLSTVKANLVAR